MLGQKTLLILGLLLYLSCAILAKGGRGGGGRGGSRGSRGSRSRTRYGGGGGGGGSLSTTVIIIIVVAVVMGVGIICIVIWCICRNTDEEEDSDKQNDLDTGSQPAKTIMQPADHAQDETSTFLPENEKFAEHSAPNSYPLSELPTGPYPTSTAPYAYPRPGAGSAPSGMYPP